MTLDTPAEISPASLGEVMQAALEIVQEQGAPMLWAVASSPGGLHVTLDGREAVARVAERIGDMDATQDTGHVYVRAGHIHGVPVSLAAVER